MVQGVGYCPQTGPILGMGMGEHGSGEGSGSRPVNMGAGRYNVEPLPEPEETSGCWTRFRNWLGSFCRAIRDFFSCSSCCEERSDSASLQGDDGSTGGHRFTPRRGSEGEEDIFGEVGHWPPPGSDNPTGPSDGVYENWGHKPFTSSGGGSKPGSSKPVEEPIYGNVGKGAPGAPQPQPPKPKPRTVKSSSGEGPRHYSGPKNGDEYASVTRTKL